MSLRVLKQQCVRFVLNCCFAESHYWGKSDSIIAQNDNQAVVL